MHRAVLRSHVVCLSLCQNTFVRLSVCDVGVGWLWSHGWNSSEIISRLVAWDVRSLQTQTSGVYSKGNTREFWPKVIHPCWFEHRRHSIANCGRMVTYRSAERSQWRAYRKPPSLFRMVPSLTPYDLPFPQNWGSICPQVNMVVIANPMVQKESLIVGRGSKNNWGLNPQPSPRQFSPWTPRVLRPSHLSPLCEVCTVAKRRVSCHRAKVSIASL